MGLSNSQDFPPPTRTGKFRQDFPPKNNVSSVIAQKPVCRKYFYLVSVCYISVCQMFVCLSGEDEIWRDRDQSNSCRPHNRTGSFILFFLRYHNILNTGQVLFMICFFCRQYHNIFTTGYFNTIFSQPDRLFYAFLLLAISQCFTKISFSISSV